MSPQECEGHTEGDHCEKCKLGYTGDPEQGGQCTICACPMPIESNNFAKNCELSSDGSFQTVQCDCVAGYMPPYCDWYVLWCTPWFVSEIYSCYLVYFDLLLTLAVYHGGSITSHYANG